MDRDRKIKELEAFAITGGDLILLEIFKELRALRSELREAKGIAGQEGDKPLRPPAKKKKSFIKKIIG